MSPLQASRLTGDIGCSTNRRHQGGATLEESQWLFPNSESASFEMRVLRF